MTEPKPVAWIDDGTVRAGSTGHAHRIITDETKRDMPPSVASAFNIPLYTRETLNALLDAERERALEEAAKVAERHDCKPCRAAPGWNDDQVLHYDSGQIDASISIASAIRALKSKGTRHDD